MTSLRLFAVVVMLCLCDVRHVHSHHNGAGPQACPIEAPPYACHGARPQTSPPPYSIVVEGDTYSPGVTVNVTLLAENSTTAFIGFLLGAHRENGSISEYIGSFGRTPLSQPRCGTGGNTGATHTNKQNKVNLTLEWTPPVSDEGDIVFSAAFVQGYATFWDNVTSDIVLKSSNYSANVTTPSPHTDPTTPQSGSKIKKDSACGDTKSCYDDCKNDDCTFLVTWYKTDQSLVITIKSDVTSGDNYWAAVGFGTQAKMNVASVTECVVNGEDVQAFTSVNRDYNNIRVSPNNQTGLSDMSGSLVDGVLSCTVHRQLVVAAGPDVFNLTGTNYHLLFARGAASGWTKMEHSATDDFVTTESYDLTQIVDIGAKANSLTLVKLHGSVMTLAWILTASVGVLVARFYKVSWPAKTTCGLKVWFAVHRASMVFTFLATVAGIIFIFVHVGGYKQLTGPEYQQAHPILGIVVTVLTVLNPIMSLFRCAPDHDARPFFNWAHWLVGSCAYILGVATVAIGTRMSAMAIPEYVTYIVVGFGAWHVLAHLLLEFTTWCERNDPMVGVYKDLQSFLSSFEAEKYRFTRHIVLATHVVIALCVTIAVLDAVIT
ncbi:putative ferric-chelate reductase 1 homolog [Littorina saxatilis]|uniref:putative ferric-chelate reductase 1 homolog n=1 Tax=Littorina saxatilis TaxID=31220 RepID=UPI0038B624EE